MAKILLAAVEEVFDEMIEELHELDWRGELAAADELHNLEAVAGGNAGFIPFALRQDLKIVFDGNAAGVESQVVEKSPHTGAGRQLLYFPVYVDVDFFCHGSNYTAGTRGFARSEKRRSALLFFISARMTSAGSPPVSFGISNSIVA